ncbi:hypothetical protein DV738_g4196, partial [Chaetothyriales sp. CBS 135597]
MEKWAGYLGRYHHFRLRVYRAEQVHRRLDVAVVSMYKTIREQERAAKAFSVQCRSHLLSDFPNAFIFLSRSQNMYTGCPRGSDMADLQEVLPDLDLGPYSHLLHSLQKNGIIVTDLITLDPLLILHLVPAPCPSEVDGLLTSAETPGTRDTELEEEQLDFVSTLDSVLDSALGGGFPAGYLSEIVGESAVGKTQFALCLLLSVQLPAPRGFSKSAIYIGTEAPLNTRRLEQILEMNPRFHALPPASRPSFDRIHCLTIHDFDTQQAIIDHHLQRAVREYNAGLVVIDSITANFRAYHNSSTSSGLAQRAIELNRIGAVLRRIAREHHLAVVVTNQVSDRFVGSVLLRAPDSSCSWRTSSPAPSPTGLSQSSTASSAQNSKLTLDYQQDFFTGWGSNAHSRNEELKTPALGLAWANQLSARVVLKLENENISSGGLAKRRRTLSVVFAPWCAPTKSPVKYSIEAQGISHVPEAIPQEHEELLREALWETDEENEEFL